MWISLSELTSKAFEATDKNVGESCKLRNNDKCFFTNETNFNSTCCSHEEPCGILQGGCDVLLRWNFMASLETGRLGRRYT